MFLVSSFNFTRSFVAFDLEVELVDFVLHTTVTSTFHCFPVSESRTSRTKDAGRFNRFNFPDFPNAAKFFPEFSFNVFVLD